MIVAAFACLAACEDDETPKGAAPSASSAPVGLSPELAGKVLARVGDRTITLGDYAEALDRMDRFERLRYQTDERRKQLLDEMIRVELLAQEAERRGIDKRPEARMMVRQVLREELLRNVREKVPKMDEIPVAEVRSYYEKHRNDYREPERRRISVIVMTDVKQASSVLAQARKASPTEWGELVRKYSIDKPPPSTAALPLELAGDLGMVTPPSHGKSDNPRVPEPVRAAVFEIEKNGEVLDRLVKDGPRVHIVRLMGVSAARDRSFAEAERTIRVKLLQQKIRDAEARIEKELRQKYPVEIHEAALGKVDVPSAETQP